MCFFHLFASESFRLSISRSFGFLVLNSYSTFINLVFWGLGLSLLTLIHSAIFANSLRACSVIFTTLFEAIVIPVSSAYMLAPEDFKHFSKSFKHIIKRRGPRQDP